MSIDVRNNFVGGLNYDDSPLVMPRECYQDALNITRDATAGLHDNVITNIVGNQLRNYTLPAGTNVVIGAFPYRLRSTVIYFVYNSNGKHSVLQYSNLTNATTKIFEDLTDSDDEDILGLTLTGKITSVNVFPRSEDEGDLLFFLDSAGRPTTMNITRFIAGEYTPVTRDIIDVGKRPPLSPPSCVYGNDATHSVNNTRNKFFRFKTRWVYDDFEKSTCSPISAMPMPANLLDDEFTNLSTNNNQITVSVNSGPQNVAKIELLVSYVDRTNDWSDFALVESIDKEELSIDDNSDYAYLFYNDATYPTIDPNESILLFDSVPELANAQEMPNGNVPTYAGITEGIDRDLDANVTITIDTVEAGGGGSTGSLNVVVTFTGSIIFPRKATFTGVPAVGTVINIKVIRESDSAVLTPITYTTVEGDTSATVVAALSTMSVGGIILVGTLSGWATNELGISIDDDYDFDEVEIIPPSSDADDNSIATWPWSTQRRLGLVYFDQKGKTNGVLYSTGITFPQYRESIPSPNTVYLPYINAKIYHVPPIWAYSYAWVITKEPTQYLFFETIDVNDTEAEFLYFDITNLSLNQTKNPTTAAVVSWTFQDGDRMRLIKRDSDDWVFAASDGFDIAVEGIVVDPVINSVATTGTFVKIKNIAPFSTEDYSSNFFIIELYRPGQQVATEENEVYYEFGIQYNILNPTTADRVHAGEVTDQSEDYVTPAEVNMYNGDSYFRARTVYLSETGFGTFYIQDRNVVDTYISAVSSVDGRPLVIDINAKRSYFSATGRFGQAYQANTNVNGLNRFYPANFYDCDISYGDIMRLSVSDRRIWVFQKFKIGQLPIFSQINKQPDGTIVNVVTDQLINPVDYYSGNFGIGDASTSLVVYNYVAYFCDNVNGVMLRLSKDGLTPISILYKVNSWANENLPLRTNGVFIYGGYDQRLNNYIITLEAAGSSPAQTLTFNEDRNSFESKLSLQPEWMCSLGTLLVAFKNGALWTHDSETYNNFFGVQYDSSITFVFNEAALQKKSWQNLTMISSSVWDCPEITTNVNSYGTTKQQSTLVEAEFTSLEQMPTTTIKRDTNSRGGKWNGDYLKGSYCIIKFRKSSASSLEYLSMVSVEFINSPLTKT